MEILEKKKRAVLGENHLETLMSIHNLVALYENMARYSEAESLYVECFEKSEV